MEDSLVDLDGRSQGSWVVKVFHRRCEPDFLVEQANPTGDDTRWLDRCVLLGGEISAEVDEEEALPSHDEVMIFAFADEGHPRRVVVLYRAVAKDSGDHGLVIAEVMDHRFADVTLDSLLPIHCRTLLGRWIRRAVRCSRWLLRQFIKDTGHGPW